MRSWTALPISPLRLSTHGARSGQRIVSCWWLPIFLTVTVLAQQSTPHPKTIATIAKEVNGSVVSIVMSDKDGHPIAQGSGFVINKDGQVVTNYHVIKSGTSAVIKFPDGAFFAVDGVLASDKNRDVAIIKAHGNDFRMLTLGDSDRVQIGEDVVAIGSPLSLESTVSNGIVSGIRTVEEAGGELLQITAPISPGSSGGPLFNMIGQVVGITTSRLRDGENLNFAIPINDIKPLLTRLSKAAAFPDEADPVAAQQTNGPSLDDTLRWMRTTSADGVGNQTPSFYSHMKIVPDSSCHNFEIIIVTIDNDPTKPRGVLLSFKFDLGDVDPDSISEDGDIIKFNITDNQSRVRHRRMEAVDAGHFQSHQLTSDRSYDSSGGFLAAGDENYRGRLAKAFKHAVILCGGKPSTF